MILLLYIIVLLTSFYLLAKIVDEYFIDSLDRISHKLRLSSDAAGATLMAAGSSSAELFVAIIALIKPGNHAAIGMGTIVGSAIFNVLVIIGAAAIVRKAVLSWQPVVRDIAFYLISIIILLIVFRDGKIILEEAAILTCLYIIYVAAVVKWKDILPHKSADIMHVVEEEFQESKKSKWRKLTIPFDYIIDKIFPPLKHCYIVFALSIIIIAALSWGLVESAIQVSHILNIPEAIIALTVLAIGTSIPDTMSSVIVAKQGRGDMAISNAIGSNIFDILFGLGVPWLIALSFTGGTIPVSTENLMSSVILLFATVLVIFFLLLIRKWKIGNKAGYILIALYLGYLTWAIIKVT